MMHDPTEWTDERDARDEAAEYVASRSRYPHYGRSRYCTHGMFTPEVVRIGDEELPVCGGCGVALAYLDGRGGAARHVGESDPPSAGEHPTIA